MNIEIYDTDGIQYRPDARKLVFRKAWQGGEDLTCGFVLDRSSAQDWPDIGYGYEVILRKGLTSLWAGTIRQIQQETDSISVMALGNWIYLDDFPYIGGGSTPGTKGRLLSDTRYQRWRPTTRDDISTRRPHRYRTDTQDRLWIGPVEGEYVGYSYRGSLYYECLYDNIKRITFTCAVGGFTGWDAQLRSWTDDFASSSSEWQYSVDGAGSIDKTLTNDRPILEFCIWKETEGDYTGDTGDTYLKITNLKIYGTAATTIHVKRVADDIVRQLEANTPIENDETQIESISLDLTPLFYENGETCLDALDDAASFGDSNNQQIAWGVESGRARIFVRSPDRDKARYLVPPEHCRRLTARAETYRDYCSAAIGQYSNEEGLTQYTSKYYGHITPSGIVANTTSTGDDLASAVYGVTKEAIPNFGRVSSTLATDLTKLFVIEHAHPLVTSNFQVVGPVSDLHRGGAWIEPYEVQTGYLVQIPHFRAVEGEGASGVDLREWDTTFMLAGLQWDNDTYMATLIPEAAKEDLNALIHWLKVQREEKVTSARIKGVKRHRATRGELAG